MGRLTSLTMRWRSPLPFDLRGTFLRMYSWEGLLDLENKKYVVSIFYLGRVQLFSRFYFGVSVHRGRAPAVQPGAHLSPASLWVRFVLYFISIISNPHNNVIRWYYTSWAYLVINTFIHSTNINVYWVLTNLPGTWDISMSKRNKNPCPSETYSSGRRLAVNNNIINSNKLRR